MVGLLAAGWIVWGSLASGGASHRAGSAVIGTLGAEKAVTDYLEVGGLAGTGGLGRASDPNTGKDSLVRLGGGARLIPVQSVVRPFLYGGFAHWHETAYSDWLKQPGAATFATSPYIHHRTGLEAGTGVSIRVPLPDTSAIKDHVIYELRASTVWFPDNEGPRNWVLVESSLGWAF